MQGEGRIEKLFSDFGNIKVLVVGDVMLDRYSVGHVERMSPEAPVPVVTIDRQFDRLGGAANVAVNLKHLGATPLLCSVAGDDEDGKQLLSIMRENAIGTECVYTSASRKTTLKHRVISGGKHVLRVDREDTNDLDDTEFERLSAFVDANMGEVGLVVIQDYNKGVLSERMIAHVLEQAAKHKVKVAVDPKKNNFLKYKNVTLFKPNAKELREGVGFAFDDTVEGVCKAVGSLQDKLKCEYLMATLSEKGAVISKLNSSKMHVGAHKRNVVDVSGAGDAVLAVAALCVALDQPPRVIVGLSNLAGGLVCESEGVVPIDRERLMNEANELFMNQIEI